MTEQAAAPIVENKSEVKSEEVKENPEVKSESKPPLAEQFQRIAKQEKFVAEERKRIEEAKKNLESEKSFADAYRSLKGKNPFEILEHFGITYEMLLEEDKKRANPIDPAVQKALDRVQELESKMSKKEREAEEAKIAKMELQLKTDIDTEIKNGDYDVIAKLEAQDSVKEYMEEIYATTGEVPTIKEACEAVTQYIVGRYSAIKDSRFFAPKESQPAPEAPKEESKASPKTLSNKMTQATETVKRPMTDAERMQAAILAFQSS